MTGRLSPFHMRRLALFLQYRQRPLMHLDPTQRASSSNPSRASLTGSKRPFSQQAAAPSDTPPSSSKAPRIDASQRSPKRNPSPSPPYRPSQQNSGMSSSRGQAPRSRGGGNSGFGFKHQPVSNPGPSFPKLQRKRFQKRHPRLEGPLHTEEYIVQQHKKSLAPLKPLHESAPKSSLGNFSMIAVGKTPTYASTEGYILADSGPVDIWRYVIITIFSYAL